MAFRNGRYTWSSDNMAIYRPVLYRPSTTNPSPRLACGETVTMFGGGEGLGVCFVSRCGGISPFQSHKYLEAFVPL